MTHSRKSDAREAKGLSFFYGEMASVKGIEYLTQLTYLDCSDNRLTDLDLSNNRELVTLLCTGNSLTELDVSNNPELVEFEWDGKKLE